MRYLRFRYRCLSAEVGLDSLPRLSKARGVTAETRAELRRLIDLHRRQPKVRELAPRRYTRPKTEEERRARRLATYRRYDIKRGKIKVAA